MKTQFIRGFAKLGLLVVMTMIVAGTSAHAQTLQYRLNANIPFDFTVADQKLPAGEYSIQRSESNSGDLVVQISSKDGETIVTRITIPVQTIEPKRVGRLVFHRYGDDYFLNEIWPAGGYTGRALPKSRSEREVQRKLNDAVGMAATKAPKAELVTIVANLP